MFHGTVPGPLRGIMHEHAREWPEGADVYVGCSGNYTIERVLHPLGYRVHSNDVQGYSSALGFWFAEQQVPFTLKEEAAAELPWLEQYLDGGAGTLAVIMLGTRFFDFVGKKGPYFRRMVAATEDQFPRMHAKTVEKILANPLRLGSYSPMDVREWLTEKVPADAPVAMFPPFFAGDYESQFASIDRMFDWPVPEYPELDEEGKDQLVEQIVNRPSWMVGLHVLRPELAPYLRGQVQTTNRGLSIYVYSNGHATRIVRPRQQIEAIPMPKIGAKDDIGDRLAIHPLTSPQFFGIRSQFMSKEIKPGQPDDMFAVSADGKIIGAFAYQLKPDIDPDTIYLLSDFPVSWSKYRRLSKLVVMAALSVEAKLLVQRARSRRLSYLLTTAFTNNPQSAKYGRGIPGMYLAKRDDAADGLHKFMLNYAAPLGQWTLAEGLDLWKRKHAGDIKKEG